MLTNAGKYQHQNGIFARSSFDFKKDLKVHKLTSLSHVLVKNGEMLAAISDKILLRQSVSNSDRHQEMPLPIQPPDSIAHVHLAFTGFHAIVSTKLGNNFYVHMKTQVVHQLKKLKCVVTAVGWNPECLRETETGAILLGTQQGSIIELNVTSTGIVNTLKELTPQIQVSSDSKLTSSPTSATIISDIQLFVLNDEDLNAKKWLIIVTQMTRVILITGIIDQSSVAKVGGFTSSASLQAGFMNIPETPSTIFHPFFTSKDSQTHVLSSSRFSEKFKNRSLLVFHPPSTEPNRFAWLSPDGLVIGKVDVFADKVQDILTEEFNLEHRHIEGLIKPPIGVVLTDYHIVLAYSTRLLAVSLLTPHNVVFEDIWPTALGEAVGFSSDPSSDFMWLHTETVSIKYRPNDEARYVWKNYLDRGEYGRALQIARTRLSIEPEAYEMVLRKQADWYIEEKNFTAAAEILAQSNEPFESVVLKFLINADERKMGLKTLLDKKLERLTRHEDKMKRDALVMWLLEVQLGELAEMRRINGNDELVKDTVDHVQRYFMRKNVFESIQNNTEAVYRICVSHADFDMQLFIANAVKDKKTIIGIYMLREQYMEVLEVLRAQAVSDLTYEMSPLLIEHIPKQLIGYFVQNIDRLRAEKLAPALALSVKKKEMAIPVIKYLEILMNSKHQIGKFLHNLFIQLVATHRSEKLLTYFQHYGTIRSQIPYDFDFAMRTCEQFKLSNCIVYLYCVAEMYSDAVNIALTIDVEMAKKCARLMDETENEQNDIFGVETVNKNRFDIQYKKNIWLKIAKHVINENQSNLEHCIGIIKESNKVITIQDILPLFPNFTKIDQFKEALVEYLEEHSEKIRNLQQAMKYATQTATEIREKAEKLKNRVTVIKAGDVCSRCSRPLAGRQFFVHACRHFFHRECLEQTMLPYLSEENQNRLKKYVLEENRYASQIEADIKVGNKSDALIKEKNYEKIAGKIASLIGTDCPLCGNIAISQIDKPFFSEEQFAEDENSWII